MLIKSLIKKIVKTAIKGLLISSLAVGVISGANLGAIEAHAANVSGQTIVDTAAQYIGKVPYVWGGNNIEGSNVGADCSGFICRIYEKFGYNFWPNRTALRNYGENLGTDISVAKLGDIIWYSGHVAIFAGYNEKGEPTIIHETGGKYSNVVWTPHKWVNAELKGVIRIPGVDGDGSGSVAATPSISIGNTYVDGITEVNAVVRGTCYKNGAWVDECGLYFGTDANNMSRVATEAVGSGANKKNGGNDFDLWYDLNGETSVRLSAGTTYYYQFYCVSGGQEFRSEVGSFKSAGEAYVEPAPVVNQMKINVGEGYYLKVRKSASIFSKCTAYIKNDVTVTIIPEKSKKNWTYITFDKCKGYVPTKYLKEM